MDLGPPIPIGLEAGQVQLPLQGRKRPAWALEEDVQYINEEMMGRRLIEAHPDYPFLVLVAGATNQTVQALFDPDVLDHAIRQVAEKQRNRNEADADQEEEARGVFRDRQIELLQDNIRRVSALRVFSDFVMWPVFSPVFQDYYNWYKDQSAVTGYDDMFRNAATFPEDDIERRIEENQYFEDIVIPLRRAMQSVNKYNEIVNAEVGGVKIDALKINQFRIERLSEKNSNRKDALKFAIKKFVTDLLEFAKDEALSVLGAVPDFKTFVPSVRRGKPMQATMSAIPYWAKAIEDAVATKISQIDPDILMHARRQNHVDWMAIGTLLEKRQQQMEVRLEALETNTQAKRHIERRMHMRSVEAERRLTRPQNTGVIRLAPNVVSAIAVAHAMLKNTLPNHYADVQVSTLQHSADVGPLFAELVARQMQRNRDGAPLSYTLDRSRASALQDQAFALRQLARYRVEAVGRKKQRIVPVDEARGAGLAGAAVQGLRDAW